MTPTPIQIRAAIDSGDIAAECRPFVTLVDLHGLHDILNRPRYTAVGSISRASFATWLVHSGLRAVIQDISANVNSPFRSVCLSLLDFLVGASESLDLSQSANAQMLSAMITEGIVSQSQAASLLAMASRVVSFAEREWGTSLTSDQVQQALEVVT